MTARLSILLVSAYFPPDTGSAAHLFYELGSALVRKGHSVTVVTAKPAYHAQGDLSRYRCRLHVDEVCEGMRIRRIALPSLPRRIPLARGVWQLSAGLLLGIGALSIKRPDVCLIYSPPLTLTRAGTLLKWLREVPFVLNVQDLFPQSVIDLGLLKNRFLIHLFERMEKRYYARADMITVHSEGNQDHLLKKGAPRTAVTVVPNWVDLEFVKPRPSQNELRSAQGLNDKFVISFGGIMGYSQDLDTVLEAASMLQSYEDVHFLLVGEGVEKPRLMRRSMELGLRNVTFLPMMPREEYAKLLSASDATLATLRAEVRTPVVPSKILSSMAAGRPVILAMDLAGDAPRLVTEEARCGLAVAPGDASGLARAVLELRNDSALRRLLGTRGRQYVEKELSLEKAAERYEQMFREVIGRKETPVD